MVDKKNIKCIRKTSVGPFWENYLVYVDTYGEDSKLSHLRIMKKSSIIKFEEEKLVQYEYFTRNTLRHPNLVNIYHSFQDYDHLYYISEYAGTSLVSFLKIRGMLTKREAMFYIAEIVSAVQYLHDKGHSFGFISPKLVFINKKGHIKLKFDFMNAIEPKKNGIDEYIEFTSPEYALKRDYNESSDYWGIGIFLYYMLVGRTPFNAQTSKMITEKMISLDISFPDFIDKDSRDLISKLTIKNPKKRLCHKSIRSHAFFKDFDWNKLKNKQINPPFLFNEPRDYEFVSAGLESLYTTDFYPGQKDGYGCVFRYFGRVDTQNPFI